MGKQQMAKAALAETWAWAMEGLSFGLTRSNARAAMGDYARMHKVDLDDLDNAPEDLDWVTFCEGMVRALGKDDRETRECAREWSDSGWYDESSGRAASMLWRKLKAED